MLKELEIYLETLLKELGYEEKVTILASSKKELGWYQLSIMKIQFQLQIK